MPSAEKRVLPIMRSRPQTSEMLVTLPVRRYGEPDPSATDEKPGTTDPANQDPNADPTKAGAAGAAGNPDPKDAAPKDGEDDFDKDRAMSTIRNLRAQEKEWSKERKELEQLRQEKKAAEDAAKTDLEKAQERLKELETAQEQRERDVRERLTRAEVKNASATVKARDAEVVLKLLDLTQVEYDEKTGEPKNVEQLVKDLVAKHPYLVGDEKASGQKATVPGTPKAEAGKPPTEEQRKNKWSKIARSIW